MNCGKTRKRLEKTPLPMELQTRTMTIKQQTKLQTCSTMKSAKSDRPSINSASRWKEHLEALEDLKVRRKQIGRVVFSKEKKIATGSNGSQIFLGIMDGKIPVAVKRLQKEIPSSDVSISDILRNKKNLEHILQNLSIEDDEDFYYYVTPLCECNLEEVIESKDNPLRKVLSQQKRLEMCMQLLQGVNELHTENIIHRDLKPSNVLLDGDGNLFLSDFGISRKLQSGTTLYTKAMGSLCWMCPDNLEGDIIKCKKSSDIQMAGCLMYYILSDGHIPHESVYPYKKNPEEVPLNFKNGIYSLESLEEECNWIKNLLQSMVQQEEGERPNIEKCLVSLKKKLDEPTSKKSFAASNLGNQKKNDVKQLAEITGSLYTDNIELTTTHLVMEADKDNTCERTLKFYQAVAAKLWVVNYEWVNDSLKRGFLVEEEPFEVKGDTVLGSSHYGPRRAREGGLLLEGYGICVIGHSSNISKDELTSLARTCGAVVGGAPSVTQTKSMLIIHVDNGCPTNQVEAFLKEAQRMMKQFRELQLVTAKWLLDSITLHNILPTVDYAVEVTTKNKYPQGHTATQCLSPNLQENPKRDQFQSTEPTVRVRPAKKSLDCPPCLTPNLQENPRSDQFQSTGPSATQWLTPNLQENPKSDQFQSTGPAVRVRPAKMRFSRDVSLVSGNKRDVAASGVSLEEAYICDKLERLNDPGKESSENKSNVVKERAYKTGVDAMDDRYYSY